MRNQLVLKSYKIIIIILMLGFAVTAKAKEFTILVDNWPPYNFQENGTIVGISTELIKAALKKANIQYKLKIYPFKRALLTVKETPYTMLITVARIPQRENMYAWIGPLQPRRVGLYKLKNRTDIQIDDIDDIKKYRTGVLSGGSVEQFFIAHNFNAEHYSSVSKSTQLLKMLFKRRFDLIPGDPLDLAYQAKILGYNNSKLERAYLLSEEGGYYMIANKNTPRKIIRRIQEALDAIIETGAKDRVINRYLQ